MFPSDSPVFEPIRNMLAETVSQINNAVAHRNAVKSGAKAPKWKSLLAQPVNDTDALSFVDETLADLLANFDVTKETATDAAHVAQKLYKLADYFAEQASLWATDLPSDHGAELSDDEIKALTEQADKLFANMCELSEDYSDKEVRKRADIEQALTKFIGQPLLVKKFDNGTVRYQLDIERIRVPRTTAISGSGNKGLALSVNGIDMSTHGDAALNFAQQVDMAFSLKALDFLDQLKTQTTLRYNTDGLPMLFAHNGKQYTVTLTKTQ